MSINELMSIITVICIKTNSLNRDEKELCIEKIVNCAIIKDGQVRKDLDKCIRE